MCIMLLSFNYSNLFITIPFINAFLFAPIITIDLQFAGRGKWRHGIEPAFGKVST